MSSTDIILAGSYDKMEVWDLQKKSKIKEIEFIDYIPMCLIFYYIYNY